MPEEKDLEQMENEIVTESKAYIKLNKELDRILIKYSKTVCPDCRIKLLKSKIKMVRKYGRMIT